MKKNMLVVVFCFYAATLLLISNCCTTTTTSIHPSTKEQPTIQYSISTNMDTVTSIFQYISINVTMKNIGNESVTLDIGGYPGGRFYIFDDNGKIINMNPKYFLTLLWGVTLEPGQEYLLYQGNWYQHTIFGRFVRNGEYHIFGGTSIIYCNGEPVSPDAFGPVNVTIARRFFP